MDLIPSPFTVTISTKKPTSSRSNKQLMHSFLVLAHINFLVLVAVMNDHDVPAA